MDILLRSHELWDIIEKGFSETEDEQRWRDCRKRDAKPLFPNQQALHETLFSYIAATKTSKHAWTILQTKFKGAFEVIKVRLQTLKQEFETMSMKASEMTQEYISRAMEIVNQIRTFSEEISDRIVVTKLLRSLTSKFDNKVTAIKEAKDLSKLTVGQLCGSLQAYEAWFPRSRRKSSSGQR